MGVCVLWGSGGRLSGQTPGEESGRINQFQTSEWQRMQEELRRHPVERPRTGGEERAVELRDEKTPESAPRIRIRKIELSGTDLIPEKEKRKILGEFEGTELSAQDLENVLRRLTNWYVKKGFVASRVFLPQQDLSGGVLKVEAIEGKVERIEVEGGARVGIGTAFPGIRGKTLQLRDVEQGLDQINRLSSRQVKMALAPGEELGGTVIRIEPGERKWLPFSIGVDNGGLKSTGEWVVRTQAMVEQALGLNDQLALSYAFDPTWKDDEHFSQAASAQFSVPYGYWTFLGGWNYSDYINEVQRLYETTGKSRGAYAGTTRLLYRDQKIKWQAGLQISWQNSTNYIDEVLLITGSRKLSSLRWSTDMSYLGDGWQGTVSLGFEQGMPWLGARSDDERVRADEPYAEGQVFTLDLGGQFNFPGQVSGGPYWWSSYLRTQYAPQRLFSSQQVSLGGQATVRGFREESVLADSGIYWRNDWSCAGFEVEKWTGGMFARVAPYVFLDVGRAFGPSVEADEKGVIAGTGAGFRLTGAEVQLDANVAFPLAAPDRVIGRDAIGFFSVRYSF